MYRVYVNERLGRVLVSGKREDLSLVSENWVVKREFSRWSDAYEYARDLADELDYILEYYLDESVK